MCDYVCVDCDLKCTRTVTDNGLVIPLFMIPNTEINKKN